jgi:hypothetical protein
MSMSDEADPVLDAVAAPLSMQSIFGKTDAP